MIEKYSLAFLPSPCVFLTSFSNSSIDPEKQPHLTLILLSFSLKKVVVLLADPKFWKQQ